jgi:hypothetical protein
MDNQQPKLRTVDKTSPPYPINKFQKDFPYQLGRELIYLLATKGKPILEGEEWEAIFAKCIGATWKPSNVGLDDVVLGNTAWGAKTVKGKKLSQISKVRLISGRNSPVFSFGATIDTKHQPEIVAADVLKIWNARVTGIRQKFENLRTVVLVKSDNLTEVLVFEFETVRYEAELFDWKWNKSGNLEGWDKSTNQHKFTWQPHGSQFTIVEDVPADSLLIKIKQPEQLDKDVVLSTLGVDNSWVTFMKRNA